MATYYKYAERSADSQVNWAEIGKGISDMLSDEVKIREEKKDAIDKSTREFQQTIANAPQGQFQDGNKFTNDYAHSIMEQQMIDTKLLKSGKMKLKDFTYRRQNYVDGTNTLFDLQKLYQENYKTRMEGLQSGELQALNGANMASVEGFGDFSKSRAVIDPNTGVVSVGILEADPNNKGVMRLTNDVVPVNVLRGKILTTIPSWRADEVMNNTVKNLGQDMDYIYEAANTSGAGTITKLLGYGALKGQVSKHSEFQASIDKANSAISSTIDSYFSNPYTVTSVLTQNTGRYNQDSFTYDKNEAAADKSKILLKINTSTGMPIIDSDGANYKGQVEEARDWVKTQLLGKLDSKREISTTAQTQLQERRPQTAVEYDKEKEQNAAQVLAKQVANLTTGSETQVQDALDYFDSISGKKSTKKGDILTVVSTDELGDEVTNTYKLNNSAGIGKAYNVNNLNEESLNKYINQFTKGKKLNITTSGIGGKTTTTQEIAPTVKIIPELFTIKSVRSAEALKSILPSNFTVTDKGGTFGNDVKVVAPNGVEYTYNSNLKPSQAAAQKIILEKFIKNNSATKGELD
jgi:hypothetical protein